MMKAYGAGPRQERINSTTKLRGYFPKEVLEAAARYVPKEIMEKAEEMGSRPFGSCKNIHRSDLDLSKWDKWDAIDFIGEIDFTKWDSAPLSKSRKINNINDIPLVPLRKLIYGRNIFLRHECPSPSQVPPSPGRRLGHHQPRRCR